MYVAMLCNTAIEVCRTWGRAIGDLETPGGGYEVSYRRISEAARVRHAAPRGKHDNVGSSCVAINHLIRTIAQWHTAKEKCELKLFHSCLGHVSGRLHGDVSSSIQVIIFLLQLLAHCVCVRGIEIVIYHDDFSWRPSS